MTVQPYDDPTIPDGDHVIRRISYEEHVIYDVRIGAQRVSSKAFRESSVGSCGMSIDIKRDIEDAGHDPGIFVMSERFSGAVEFRAEVPRSAGLVVGREPMLDNPHHGEVWRPGENRRFTKRQQRIMHRHASWLNEMEGVRLRA